MARDRRFVDVFDFKSFLTSPARAPAGRVLHTHPKRILAIYHDATPQSGRSICRRRCAKRLAEIKQGAGPRAHLRSPRIRLRRRLIIIIFQWFIEGVTGGTGRFANRPGAQKFCPWRSVECLEAPGRTADRRSLRAEYRPYADTGYRDVCALFIGVDCARFDFESLDMNAPMSAATSSGFSSSAKWPASIRWTSASGISRL